METLQTSLRLTSVSLSNAMFCVYDLFVNKILFVPIYAYYISTVMSKNWTYLDPSAQIYIPSLD